MSNPQTQRMMLRIAILGEYEGPVDGKPSEFSPGADESDAVGSQHDKADSADPGGKRLTNSEDSTADKVFIPTPWVKPPRRKPFNETSTRGWRREYQREYRAEHGNS